MENKIYSVCSLLSGKSCLYRCLVYRHPSCTTSIEVTLLRPYHVHASRWSSLSSYHTIHCVIFNDIHFIFNCVCKKHLIPFITELLFVNIAFHKCSQYPSTLYTKNIAVIFNFQCVKETKVGVVT